MGTWGEGPLDNDTAADLAVWWRGIISKCHAKDPRFWSAKRVADLFQRLYFRNHIDPEDSEHTEVLLALAALFHKEGLEIPSDFKRFVEAAALTELRATRLEEWPDPKTRESAINRLLVKIKGTARPLGGQEDSPERERRVDRLQAEVDRWVEFSRHYERWVEISGKPFGNDEFFDLVPRWFFELQDFVGRGLRHDNKSLIDEAKKYRLMHLAWYTGFVIRLPDSERLALINAAERIGSDSYIMPS